MGKERISSQEISDYTNINATQIRRDLSAFGKFGKRGVGYNIESLLGEIRKILRTQGQHNVALIGAGRLGQAIASSPIFAEHGINIAAIFDTDPERVGDTVGTATVTDPSALKDTVREENIVVGVIAVPAHNAQEVADELVDSGVRIIFNYSEALLEHASGRGEGAQRHSGPPWYRLDGLHHPPGGRECDGRTCRNDGDRHPSAPADRQWIPRGSRGRPLLRERWRGSAGRADRDAL